MIKDEVISYKGKTVGVRLDAIDHYILQKMIASLNAGAPGALRLALTHYANALGIETDRATIAKTLRRETDITDE